MSNLFPAEKNSLEASGLTLMETVLARLAFDLASSADPAQSVLSLLAAERSILLVPLQDSFAALDLVKTGDAPGIELRVHSGLEIPRRWAPLVAEFVTESVRNWQAHGRQSRAERKFSSKSEQCRILFEVAITPQGLRLEFHDDGPGLLVPSAKEHLRNSGIPDAEKAALEQGVMRGDHSALYCQVFEEGWSTRDRATIDAGRGMGLSRIRRLVEEGGGAIQASPSSVLGGFCLSMEIPLHLLGAWVDRSGELYRIHSGKSGQIAAGSEFRLLHRLPKESAAWAAQSFGQTSIHWMVLEAGGASSSRELPTRGVLLDASNV